MPPEHTPGGATAPRIDVSPRRPSGRIPNPQQWNLISDERFDEFDGLVDAEKMNLAASHAYRCEDCGRLWIFWDGHGAEPVEYVPIGGRTDTSD